MITFDNGYTSIGVDTTGSISEVPVNGYLRSVTRERAGIHIQDTEGNWGIINYTNTSFDNNYQLYNYLYPYTQIGKIQTKKIEICASELIDCFTNEIELLEAQGIGLIIMPIALGYSYKLKTAAYNFADDLYVHCSTKTDADALFVIDRNIINATGVSNVVRSSVLYGINVGYTPNDNSFAENDSLVLKAKTSDATTGDGHLVLYLTYTVVEEAWRDGVYCV